MQKCKFEFKLHLFGRVYVWIGATVQNRILGYTLIDNICVTLSFSCMLETEK